MRQFVMQVHGNMNTYCKDENWSVPLHEARVYDAFTISEVQEAIAQGKIFVDYERALEKEIERLSKERTKIEDALSRLIQVKNFMSKENAKKL